jgi:peptidoglycan lytic transglycosylase
MPGGMRGAKRIRQVGLLAALGVLLSACGFVSTPSFLAEPRIPHPTYKVGGPYTVNGTTYYPRVDYAYDRVGVASWYGEQFQGRYTANGEVFDLNGITAAHTTLPLPSIVEVVNLQNNRALRIRVNDRGPFVDGRLIDLSRRAAQLLGFERNGTTPVRVRVLRDESLRAGALAERGIINDGDAPTTAVAATPEPPVPRPVLAEYQPPPAGLAAPQPPRVVPVYPAVAVGTETPPRARQFFVEDPVYRVQAGPVATQDEADRLRARLIANGYRDARIVID